MFRRPRKDPETYFLRRYSKSSIKSSDLPTISSDSCEKIKLSKLNNVIEDKITNCENLAFALDRFNTSQYEEYFRDIENVLYVKVEIRNGSTEIKSPDLYELIKKCLNKSIVIVISLTSGLKSCVYWKPKELDYFFQFKPHDGDLLDQKFKLCEFIGDFLSKSLKDGHIGLSNDCEYHRESFNVELHHFADDRNYNLLLQSAESGDNHIVEIFVKSGLSANHSDQKINAQELAWNGQHFDVVLTLLKMNLTYPESFDYNECSCELKEFDDEAKDIHEAIFSGNINFVQQIVLKNPNSFFFYNSKNESAAKVALISEQIEIYEFLLINGVFFGPHENTSDVMEDLNCKFQRVVRDLHFKHSKEIESRHITFLMAHSFICHDVTNVKKSLEQIHHAFSVLNKSPFIEPILKIVAASQNYRIIFDFNRESVNFLDPTVDLNTQGLFYMSGRIYVGAKQLLHQSTENETIANLAHELCHYAMQLGFKNQANPYSAIDQKTKVTFEEISQECQKIAYKEEVIEMVYSLYPEDMYHAELIVRPVHLYALYHNNPDQMEQIRENFKRLFIFYEQFVVKHIKEAIPRVEGKVTEELEQKQKLISKLKFYFIVFAVFSVISLAFMGLILYTPTFVFKDLSKKDQMTVFNSFVQYKHVQVKLYDLFPNNSLAYDKLTSNHISTLLNNEILNLDDQYSLYLDSFIDHNWNNLSLELKHKLLNTSFIFQNETVMWSDVYEIIEKHSTESDEKLKPNNVDTELKTTLVPKKLPKPSNPLEMLTSNQIKSILNDELLNIGYIMENKTRYYIDRKFVYEDTRAAYIIYQRSQTLSNVSYEVGFKYFPVFSKNLQYWEDHGNLNGYSLINGTIKDIYRLLSSMDFDTYVLTISEVERASYVKNNEKYYKDLTSDMFGFLHRSFDDIYKILQDEKFFILSSIAGAGKTVAFEQLALRMKKQFPLSWTAYIDLKDYVHLYKSYSEIEEIEELLLKILNINYQNDFEQELFKKYFENGYVILLWNGFDEISPTYSQDVLSIIRKIRLKTKNIQLICTRPLYSTQLRDYFRVRTYQLLPYNKDEQRNFLTKFYKLSLSTTGFKNYENLTEIDTFIEKVRSSITKLSVKGVTSESLEFSRDFNTPLMLILLGENFIQDSSYDDDNFYEIYQKFVYKKVKIWSEIGIGKEISNKIIASSQGLSVPEIHQKYALPKEIFERLHTIITVNLKKLKIMKKFVLPEMTWQEISRLGMLYINGENKYEFVHKTFAEFFTAQYLIQNIYYADEDINKAEGFRRLELFFFVAQNYGNNQLMVTEFMESFIQTQKDSVGKFSPTISDLIKTSFKRFFFDLVNPKFSKLFKFILDFFKKDHEVLLELLHVNNDETLYTAMFNPTYYLRLVDPQEILKIVKDKHYLTDDEFQKFKNGKNQKGIIQIGLAYFESQNKPKRHHQLKVNKNFDSHIDLVDFLIKNLTELEQKELYKTIMNPAFYIASDPYVVTTLDKIWERIENLLAKNEIQNIVSSTIDQLIRKYPEFEFFDRPINVIEFLLTKSEKIFSNYEIYEMFLNHKILHIGTYNHYAFKVLWNHFENHTTTDQQRKMLKEKDDLKYYKKIDYYFFDYNVPLTILHLSLMRDYENKNFLYDFVEEKYFKLFSKSEIQDVIASSSDFLAQYVSRNFDINDLMELLARIYKEDHKQLDKYLKQKIKFTNISVFEYFDELRTAEKFRGKMKSFSKFIEVTNQSLTF